VSKRKQPEPVKKNLRRVPYDLMAVYENEAARASKRAGVPVDWWTIAVADMRNARGLGPKEGAR